MASIESIKQQLSQQFEAAIHEQEQLPDVATKDAQELRGQLGGAALVIIDVRTEEEFAAGHIVGAVNFPYHAVAADASALAAFLAKTPAAEVVFVSLESPDLDDAVAHMVSETIAGTTSLALLLGGFRNWVAAFRDDAAATTPLDAAAWPKA